MIESLFQKTNMYGLMTATLQKSEYDRVDRSMVPAGTVCSICLDGSSKGGWIQLKKVDDICGHFFHEKCLTPWIEKQASCPNCKRSLRVEKKETSPLMERKVYQVYLARVGILICSFISLGFMALPLMRSKVESPVAELSLWMFVLHCVLGGVSSEAMGAISMQPTSSESFDFICSRGRIQVIASTALAALSFATFFQGCLGAVVGQKVKVSYIGSIVGAMVSSIVAGYGFLYGRQSHRIQEEALV